MVKSLFGITERDTHFLTEEMNLFGFFDAHFSFKLQLGGNWGDTVGFLVLDLDMPSNENIIPLHWN